MENNAGTKKAPKKNHGLQPLQKTFVIKLEN